MIILSLKCELSETMLNCIFFFLTCSGHTFLKSRHQCRSPVCAFHLWPLLKMWWQVHATWSASPSNTSSAQTFTNLWVPALQRSDSSRPVIGERFQRRHSRVTWWIKLFFFKHMVMISNIIITEMPQYHFWKLTVKIKVPFLTTRAPLQIHAHLK